MIRPPVSDADDNSPAADSHCRRQAVLGARVVAVVAFAFVAAAGCAEVRVTNTPRTADEQFLQSAAINRAVADLSFVALRDKRVFVDSTYLYDGNFPSSEQSYLLGELRNRLLIEGAAIADSRQEAEVILEVRSGAIGVNRSDFLLGFPGVNLPVGSVEAGAVDVPVLLPEISIVKRRTQLGFASVSITAFFADTGELVASSGPFVGRTERVDYWFFGLGPRTTGNIPPAEE